MARTRKTEALVAAVAVASLADQWLDKVLPEVGKGVSVTRSAPSMPQIADIKLLKEENERGQINGVNLQLTFAPGRKADKKHQAIAELWVSREINLVPGTKGVEGQEDTPDQYRFDGIIVTRACNLDTRRELGATANAIAMRFGKQGDGDDTYFATMVPSNQALDKVMEDAIKAINSSPELLADFKSKGWVKEIKAKDGSVTHIIEFPASKIGYSPMLFCPIGKDGKPDVNAYADNWSSTRNKGTGWLFKWGTASDGSIVATPESDSRKPNSQASRSFRGQTFKNGTRAEQVAKNINAQIQAHKVWKDVQAIVAQPFTERNKDTTVGKRPQFVAQAPKGMQAPQSGAVQVGAGPVANTSDIQF